ncbi:MAG: ribosome maturation factor RimM [Acidobacteriota bacterium]
MVVARVLRAHGLRGEVVVAALTDVPERLASGSECLLVATGRPRRTVRILQSRRLGEALGLLLEGCADRDAAEQLRGASLEIETARVPPAPRGSYWQHELLGCRVSDEREGELGVVVELVDAGGGLLLAIERPAGDREAGSGRAARLLVPFAEAYLRRVDVAARRIDMALPEGLVEACGSR